MFKTGTNICHRGMTNYVPSVGICFFFLSELEDISSGIKHKLEWNESFSTTAEINKLDNFHPK